MNAIKDEETYIPCIYMVKFKGEWFKFTDSQAKKPNGIEDLKLFCLKKKIAYSKQIIGVCAL